jgi:hypothetical protein
VSEPIVPTIDDAAELVTLRRVNAELLTKNSTRKARVLELEANVTELQGKLTAADANVHSLTIDGPLKTLAQFVSTDDELFLDLLSKTYKVEMVKGALTLMTTDGKPVLKGTTPVPLESQALLELLTADGHPHARTFRTIMIASRASGAGVSHSTSKQTEPKKATMQFGLR